MPGEKLTKKDVVKMLPSKLAKYFNMSLDKLITQPMAVIGVIFLMNKYANSPKSSAEFKRIYFRALGDGYIHMILSVAVTHTVVRALLYLGYKAGNISKKDYQQTINKLERALSTQLAGLTLLHLLYRPDSIKDAFKMYLRGLDNILNMPNTVRRFIKHINPNNPSLATMLKAIRAFKIKAPWLSKLTVLLRKLKKDKNVARKFINLAKQRAAH